MFVYIDVETIPTQPEAEAKAAIAATIKAPTAMKKQETVHAWHNGEGKYAGDKLAAIEDKYRKTSFDGGRGELISISYADEDDEVESLHRQLGESEASLLARFFAELDVRLAGRPPYFIGHNVPFDLGFLYRRAIVLGVKPPFKLPFDGRHGSDYFDTMQAWAGFRERISQDNLCSILGLPQKPDGIDGSKVWDYVKAGKVDEVAEYNRYDVEAVRLIHRRLTFS